MARFNVDGEIVFTGTDSPISHSRDYLQKQSLEQHRQIEKMRRNSGRQVAFSRAGIFLRLIVLVACFILFVRVFSRLRGGDSSLNFSGFLQWLSTLNTVDVSFDVDSFHIGGDWGWFDGFRNFLNFFATLFSVICWCFVNVYNVLLYVVSFLRFLFV